MATTEGLRAGRPRRRSRPKRDRRGSAALEFALVAIPLFLFFFASIEFGRAMMAQQSLDEAARAGCRRAILHGITIQEVEDEVETFLNASAITQLTVTVNPSDLDAALRWDPVTVTVTTTFDHVSWLPLPRFLSGKTCSATCTMGRECEEKEKADIFDSAP